MNGKLPVADCQLPIARQYAAVFSDSIVNRQSKIANGFTLIEVMVVVTLLSLIVLALMAVFNGTQTAFRASVTQADLQEGGRAAMDLIADDLREMAPSFGTTNPLANDWPVNFFAAVTTHASPPSPLYQSLLGSVTGAERTNVLENIFILSRQNQTWAGTGYAVGTNPPGGGLYPLYRFHMTTNTMTGPAGLTGLFNTYINAVTTNGVVSAPNWSHLADGVVHLTVRAYDTNGFWMTNGYSFGRSNTLKNTRYITPEFGEVGFVMYSNSLPASVEIDMGVLEDRALQRAESLSGNFLAQSNYLAGRAGQVHVFRQRVSIPNVDPSAYQ